MCYAEFIGGDSVASSLLFIILIEANGGSAKKASKQIEKHNTSESGKTLKRGCQREAHGGFDGVGVVRSGEDFSVEETQYAYYGGEEA